MRILKIDSSKHLVYNLIPETRHEKHYLDAFRINYGFIKNSYKVQGSFADHKSIALLIDFIKRASK